MKLSKRLGINLVVNGKKKRFKTPTFISSEVFQKTLELERDLDTFQDPEFIFQKLYPLICEVFGNQFTVAQLQNGIDIREVMPLAHKVLDHVIENMELKGNVRKNNIVVPFRQGKG